MNAMTTERLPYTADSVVYADFGHTVEAIWTPDPELAADPKKASDMQLRTWNDDSVEIETVATMTRLYKSEGALVSGWQIVVGRYVFMAGTRKRDALKVLRETVAERFDH
ncbi:hypothetical protein ACFVH6_21740 [Spirillospora sp. NPDC127200]